MKVASFVLLAVAAVAPSAFAYRPMTWTKEHAALDFERSELVIIGRVVGFSRTREEITERNPATGGKTVTIVVGYTAEVSVARVLRGKEPDNKKIAVPIGGYLQAEELDDAKPTDIAMHNTQAGFDRDIAINGVYVICLNRIVGQQRGARALWEPRSGHHSFFRIRTAAGRARRLVVTPTVAPDAKPVPLDAFLKSKLKQGADD